MVRPTILPLPAASFPRVPLTRVTLLASLLLAACDGGATMVQTLPPDLSVVENDCVTHPERCGCTSDQDCTADPLVPRCDNATHACVPCLPFNDNCPAGQSCTSVNHTWLCVAACATNADCLKIGGGTTCCRGACLNLATDLMNCGACGTACAPVTNGGPSCVNGACVVGQCNPGFDDCDRLPINGCETVLNNDAINCGACGKACSPFANGLPVCNGGRCSAICGPGYGDCNANLNDGCEVDTTFDVKSCGSCGRMCPVPANANAYCDLGKCGFRCKLGFGDCDGNPGNGCEAAMDSDPASCGHCGNFCPVRPGASAAACKAGQCGSVCNQGFGDCDNNPFNGCEANLANSVAACGACGKLCKNNNAIATCANGMCTLQCNPGFVDCNMDPNDGCEANLLSDGKNCAGCGNVCPPNTPFCQKGVCANLPPTCRVVNGIRWCYDPNCGIPCAQTCINLNLPFTIDDNTWLAAQSQPQQCIDIATAFGLPNNTSISSYTYGCAENEAAGDTNGGPLTGRIICSNYAGCPLAHRTTMDAVGTTCANGGRHSICPCQ